MVQQKHATIHYLFLYVIKILLLKCYALGKADTIILVIFILYCCIDISYQAIFSCVINHFLQLSILLKELMGF